MLRRILLALMLLAPVPAVAQSIPSAPITIFNPPGGSSSCPGGSTTQLLYNNAGACGGISGATTDGAKVTFTTITAVNLNTVAAPTPTGGTVLQLTGTDATISILENNGFGGVPTFTGRRANGTGAAPTTVVSGNALASFSGRGYDTTGYFVTASIQPTATETFTASAHGTDIVLNITAATTTTLAEGARVKSSGFTIPTGSTYQINNIQITTAALSDASNIALLNAANTFTGNTVISSASFGLSGNITVPAWTTSGVRYKNVAATLTDTSSSGTVTAAYTDLFGGNTIAASSAVTFTKYATFKITAPTAGTNVTFTNSFALDVDSLSVGTSGTFRVSAAGILTTTGALLTTPDIGVATGTSLALSGIISHGTEINTGNGAASVSQVLWNGTVFTGGSGTTTFPAMFVQPSGTTAATTWSTSGTGLGMNLASGFAGNFLDFHVAGAARVFGVSSAGTIILTNGTIANGTGGFGSATANAGYLAWTAASATVPGYVVNSGANTTGVGGASGTVSLLVSGTELFKASTGALTASAPLTLQSAIISGPSTATLQQGAADAAVAVAQTLRVQSVVAGTAAANGANWTLIGSLPTGTGTSGDIIFQTGVKTGSGTTQGTATTALVLKGESGNLQLPRIASDAGLTDTTVCQDTTNHALFSGSGTLGICLGTSSMRFKVLAGADGPIPMANSLSGVMRLNLINYRYKHGYGDNGARRQNGVFAEDLAKVFPDCVVNDKDHRPVNVDGFCLYFHSLKAQQEMQVEIVSLQRRVASLSSTHH